MNNCIVTVETLDNGLYREWRGVQYPVRGVHTGDMPDEDMHSPERHVTMWACMEADVPIVVEQMSKEWAGHEIKLFNLMSISTRLLGEIKTKELTKDGVFPV
jgi:hypothetical protein